MSMSSKLTCFLLLLVLLAGCAAPSSTPQPTLQVWRVQRTPALGWMDDSINQCIREQPGSGVLLSGVTAAELDPLQADISLTWDTVPVEGLPVFQLGTDQLAVAIHPDNPLRVVTSEQFSNIISGKWTTWQQVDESLSGEISWWLLPPGDETRTLLEKTFEADLQMNPFAWLAPDPSAVVQSVAADTLAIGVVPSRWVDKTVKSIPLQGVDGNTLTLPILAIARQQPDSAMTAFLGCLQKNIGK